MDHFFFARYAIWCHFTNSDFEMSLCPSVLCECDGCLADVIIVKVVPPTVDPDVTITKVVTGARRPPMLATVQHSYPIDVYEELRRIEYEEWEFGDITPSWLDEEL